VRLAAHNFNERDNLTLEKILSENREREVAGKTALMPEKALETVKLRRQREIEDIVHIRAYRLQFFWYSLKYL